MTLADMSEYHFRRLHKRISTISKYRRLQWTFHHHKPILSGIWEISWQIAHQIHFISRLTVIYVINWVMFWFLFFFKFFSHFNQLDINAFENLIEFIPKTIQIKKFFFHLILKYVEKCSELETKHQTNLAVSSKLMFSAAFSAAHAFRTQHIFVDLFSSFAWQIVKYSPINITFQIATYQLAHITPITHWTLTEYFGINSTNDWTSLIKTISISGKHSPFHGLNCLFFVCIWIFFNYLFL